VEWDFGPDSVFRCSVICLEGLNKNKERKMGLIIHDQVNTKIGVDLPNCYVSVGGSYSIRKVVVTKNASAYLLVASASSWASADARFSGAEPLSDPLNIRIKYDTLAEAQADPFAAIYADIRKQLPNSEIDDA
jgi:hypothetical protein